MREILFRGKDWRNGEWKYGDLFTQSGTAYIRVHKNDGDYEDFEVITETVGQYTGMLDKGRKRIFEGDIIEWHIDVNNVTHVGKVVYEVQGFNLQRWTFGAKGWSICRHYSWGKSHIIGNIFDNSELLEEGQ